MGEEYSEHDREVMDKLRKDAALLGKLEQQLKTVKQERDELLDSTTQLSQEIEELLEIRDEWEWFFEHSLEMLCVAGMDGYFKRVNPAFTDTLGYSQEMLLSRPFIDFVHPDDVEMTRKELEALGAGEDSVSFENRYQDAEGNWRWILWYCPAKSASSDKLYAIARDITSRKRREAEILYRASHDSLTELLNRAAFEERTAEAIARHGRSTRQQLALYMVDLDGFKEVNDTYGHPAGDKVLKEIAQRLRTACRDNETVCRLGGDEFAILAEGLTGFELEPLAWRIIKLVEPSIDIGVTEVSVNCSIGIATYPEAASDLHSLMSQADAAMYEVKRACKAGFFVVGQAEPVFCNATIQAP